MHFYIDTTLINKHEVTMVFQRTNITCNGIADRYTKVFARNHNVQIIMCIMHTVSYTRMHDYCWWAPVLQPKPWWQRRYLLATWPEKKNEESTDHQHYLPSLTGVHTEHAGLPYGDDRHLHRNTDPGSHLAHHYLHIQSC